MREAAFWDRPAVVLAATTWVQVLCSGAMLLAPTLAPSIAAQFDVATGLIGLQVSLLYAAAMLTSTQAGVIARRLGPCQTSRLALLLVMLGCLAVLPAHPLGLLLATAVLGAAYGLTNPAASHLLARYTTSSNRNRVFSIKQTGVPLGGMLVGLTAPKLSTLSDWRLPFLVFAVLALVTLAVLRIPRGLWDRGREPGLAFGRAGSLGLLLREPAVFWLGCMGFCLAAAQLSLMTFAVAYMVESLTLTLVAAGLMMSLIHGTGVIGRVGWGWLADRLRNGMAVLIALSAVMVFGFGLLTQALPIPAALLLLLLVGVTAIGWNGVYMAEVARRSQRSAVAEATAGVLVLTYLGVLTGPALFSLVVTVTDRYAPGFLVPTGFAVGAVISLLICRRIGRRPGRATASDPDNTGVQGS